MSAAAVAERTSALTAMARERAQAAGTIQAIDFIDTPLWFYARLDRSRRWRAVFRSGGFLAVYAGGDRQPGRAPSCV